ncbi:hypothetical protein A2U01_0045848, partial [Trifolium medium]|nr:hypothetical protein [Trifolium medium]
SQRDDDTEAAPTTRKQQISTDLEESNIKALQPKEPPVNKDLSNNNDNNVNPKRTQTTAVWIEHNKNQLCLCQKR